MKTKYLNKCLTILLAFLTPVAFSQKNIPKKQSDKLKTEAQYSVTDQVIADDLIVTGSACIGFDCVNGEVFGFHTIRLKENNLRIHFDDTSASPGTFPSNDWEIEANSSASGGTNSYAINDVTGAKTPFKIIAGAPTNSLFVHSTGRIGLGTATPILDIHSSTGNTPGLRFEQSNSSGFTPQTWDMAGNEANFFIRDVTNGSRLPFRIRPGAPTSSIDILANSVNIKGVALIDPTSPSDRRLKENITSIENASNILEKLKPKSYLFNKKAIQDFGFSTKSQFGLIAQDVELILPNLIRDVSLGENNEKYKSVNYEALIPLLIQGFKEQQTVIVKLKEELFKFKTLESRLATIEAKLEEQAVNVPLKTDKK